ncbi:hypothetical protein FHS11_001123 [Mucilaginibacter gotjawali]|uniref:Uncharacterized protein n=1 Tax=Mucilaginibacter gotjawali TaxID=1550579 RepID=A0A839SBR4_9SPHI|nr:hypothetical protein [Mucilaginibacter gotjawali]
MALPGFDNEDGIDFNPSITAKADWGNGYCIPT